MSELLIKNTIMYTVENDFFRYGKMAEFIFNVTSGLYGDTVPF